MRRPIVGVCIFFLVAYLFILPVEISVASELQDDKSIIITRVKGTTIICNKGKKHGIDIGMVFNIIRDGHNYGKAEVLVVKETISGLKLRQISSGFRPQVNDKLERYVPVKKFKKKSVKKSRSSSLSGMKSAIEPYFLGSVGLIISETDIGVSFILGFQASFHKFRLTANPADLGGIPEDNQDPRYRKYELQSP